MKRILLLPVIAFTMMQFAHSQVEFGVKAGASFADVTTSGINLNTNFLDPRMIAGFTGGVFAEMPLGSGFYFAPEFNYTQKGFRVQESVNMDLFGVSIPIGAEAVTRMHYLDLPLTLKYKFGGNAIQGYVRAGPTVGYAIGGSVTTRLNSIIDIRIAKTNINPQGEMYNALELGGVVGAGIEIPTANGKFFVDASYSQGFTNIFDVPVVDLRVKNRAVGLGIGYALTF